jgi:hypothetical protein
LHTFAQKPKTTQEAASAKYARPGRAHSAQSREANSIRLQRVIENQAVQLLLPSKPDSLRAPDAAASGSFGHDFSQISVHAKRACIQPKLAVKTPEDIHEQEADRISEQVTRMPEPQLRRACSCVGGCPKCQAEQFGYRHERMQIQHVESGDWGQTEVPSTIHEVLSPNPK